MRTAVAAVYIHFPFCASRCPYCDFAVSVRPEIPHAVYANAILSELAQRCDGLAARPLVSIFVGGGTPSLWASDELARVLEGVAGRFGAQAAFRDGSLEVTAEANPGDLTPTSLAGLRRAGINRLSIGVQALDDSTLQVLGRRHTADEARAGLALAREAGFSNVSLDLMFAVPTESPERWARTVDELIALAPEHASLYQLTVEKGTPFGAQQERGLLALPCSDGESSANLYELARAKMESAGYELYEISNYAKPGLRCRHNLQYWTGGEWLGLGVSAVSQRKLGTGLERTRVTRNIDEYLATAPTSVAFESRERFNHEEALAERVWLGLRVIPDGLHRALFLAEQGVDPVDLLARRLDPLVAAGWVEVTPERVRLTRPGVLVADEVALRLLP